MPASTAEDRAARRAAIEREEAAERLAAERAALEMRERQTKLTEADAFVKDLDRRDREQWEANRQDVRDRKAKLDAMTLPQVTISPAAARAALDAANRLTAQWDAQELDAALQTVESDEQRKIYEPGFRQAYQRIHHGGLDACTCLGHRVMRREV